MTRRIKPRKSRREYMQRDDRSTTSILTEDSEKHSVSVPVYIPVPTPQLPQFHNNVTMTMQEYHVLMRNARQPCSRCIYFPDSCRRFQPMNVWCSTCISDHMFPEYQLPSCAYIPPVLQYPCVPVQAVQPVPTCMPPTVPMQTCRVPNATCQVPWAQKY